MKIKSTSWHYRLNTEFMPNYSNSVPESLCPYMRVTMYRLIFALICTLVIPALFLLAGTYPAEMLSNHLGLGLTYANPLDLTVMSTILAILIGMLVLSIGAAAMWCCILYTTKFGEWRQERRFKKRGVARPEPGLFMSYIKAKKSKICPMIEVEH